MELRNIDYFLCVADAGSLRAAARGLGLTQPALTKAIRRLEDEAGVTMFERRARGVSLTPYGQCFLRHARALRANMNDARHDIEALRKGTTGHVRIGAGPSWQGRILPEAIRRYRAERPGVQVQIKGGLDDGLKADLRRGDLDLVVAALPEGSEDPDLVGLPLLVDHYRVVADARHPLHSRANLDFPDLLEFPWILPSQGTYLVRRLEVLMRTNGLPPPKPAIETDIVPLKLSLMQGEHYLSFHAVDHLAALGEHQIRPLPLAAASWLRRAGVITRHDVEPSPATQYLIQIIETVCHAVTDPALGADELAPVPA